MNPIITDNLSQIQILCKQHKVSKLFVFGSVLTDSFNKNSDVDFIVEFNEMEHGDYADNFFNFAENLETLLNKSIDLISEKTIKNPYFLKEIQQKKELVYV